MQAEKWRGAVPENVTVRVTTFRPLIRETIQDKNFSPSLGHESGKGQLWEPGADDGEVKRGCHGRESGFFGTFIQDTDYAAFYLEPLLRPEPE